MLLRSPDKGALHLPWLQRVRATLGDLSLGLPLALVPPKGYIPDFLTPPPEGPLTDIHEELAQVRATPGEQVRREVGRMDRPPSVPSRDALVDALGAYWDRALEPDWPRIRAFLQADIQHRARVLAEVGPARLLASLHPSCDWEGDKLIVRAPNCDFDVDLGGRGLLLVPSAFLWDKPKAIINEPWQPTLLYPARGIGILWDEPSSFCALDALLGANRAAVLETCEAPRSTTEIARQLGLTPGGVSQHLKILRGAGLVQAERVGREVLYVRSEAANALLSAAA